MNSKLRKGLNKYWKGFSWRKSKGPWKIRIADIKEKKMKEEFLKELKEIDWACGRKADATDS